MMNNQPQNTDFAIFRPGIANGSELTILRKEAVAEFLENYPEYVFVETRSGYDEYIRKEHYNE